MTRRRTRQIATGAAVALLAAGGGVAYAASSESPSDTRERGWGPGPGAYGYAAPADRPAPGDRLERRHFGGPGLAMPAAPFEGAAEYLGLDEDELLRRLGNGRTLREIATAEGRSVEGLKSALVEAARQRLDDAVENGPLSEEDRDRLLADLERRIDDVVDRRLLQGGPGFRGGPGGPGFHLHRFGGGECGPGEDGRAGRAAPPARSEDGERARPARPAEPRADEQEQDGRTVPGSWGGAASGTVTA